MRKLYAFYCRAQLIVATGFASLGFGLMAVRYPLIVGVFVVAAVLRRLRNQDDAGTSHGSARAATPAEIAGRSLLDDSHEGLIFGKALGVQPSRRRAALGLISPMQGSEDAVIGFNAAFLGDKAYRDRFITIQDFTHILTVAPSGAGKNVSSILPNLLHYAGNVLAFDPKGENFDITHVHREKVFGHRSIRLDPTGMHDKRHGPGDTYNPFDGLDPKRPNYLEMCRDMGAMLVTRSGYEPDSHWLDSCEIVCASVIAFVGSCVAKDKRSFKTFRMIVSSPEYYAETLEIMKGRDECRGVIELLGNQLSWFQGKELFSVLTTVHRMTGFLDSPMVADNMAKTSFPLDILKTGHADAYLVVPPPMMAALAPLVRLWLGCLLRQFTKYGPSEHKKLLVIVDEAAVLGKQKAIEEGITLMRGYGLRIWLVFQSIQQAQACFGDNAQVIIDNMGTQQYFGISSLETAKTLSERIGDATILVKSLNETFGRSYSVGGKSSGESSRNYSRSVTSAPHARRVLQPNEILTLPGSFGMLFHKNMHMIPTRLVRYYDAPEFAERWPGSKIRGTGKTPYRLDYAAGLWATAAMLSGLFFVAAMMAVTGVLDDRPTPIYPPAPGMYQEPHPMPSHYGPDFNRNPMPSIRPNPYSRPLPRYRPGW